MKKIKLYTTEPRNKQEAQRRATELANFMSKNMGGKWKTRVWENLGWHYQVNLGSISLYYHTYYSYKAKNGKHVHEAGNFSTLISSVKRERGAGAGIWSTNNYNKNPVLSVKKAIKKMEEVVNSYVEVMNDNRNLLKK